MTSIDDYYLRLRKTEKLFSLLSKNKSPISMRSTEYNIISAETFKGLLEWHPRDLLKLMLMVSKYNRLDPNNISLVLYDSIPREKPRLAFLKDFECLFAGTGKCRDYNLCESDEVYDSLINRKEFLAKLKYDNYVIAGDFVLAHCGKLKERSPQGPLEPAINCDEVEFYLVSPEYYETNDMGLQKDIAYRIYGNLLKELQAIFKDLALIEGITIKRSSNCTIISLNSDSSEISHPTIKIVHKIYPSKQSVVIDFEQIPSKVFYDHTPVKSNERSNMGQVYFTLDAAIAHYYGINPIDWTNDFSDNMNSYKRYADYGYSILFPGLSFDLINFLRTCEKVSDDKGKEELDEGNRKEGFAIQIRQTYHLPGARLKIDNYKIRERQITDKNNLGTVNREIDIVLMFPNDRETLIPFHDQDEFRQDCSVLSHVIRNETRSIFSLYSVKRDDDWATTVIDTVRFLDVRKLLITLSSGYTIAYYFGEVFGHRYWKIYSKAKSFQNSFPIKGEDLDEYLKCCNQANEILTLRIQEINSVLIPALEELRTIKFDGFRIRKPKNKNPREFWGPQYTPTNNVFYFAEKRTIYMIWKFRKEENPSIGQLGKDIIYLLFRLLDQEFLRDAALGKVNTDEIVKSIAEKKSLVTKRSREDVGNYFYPFPWHHNAVVIDRNKYLSKVRAKNSDDE